MEDGLRRLLRRLPRPPLRATWLDVRYWAVLCWNKRTPLRTRSKRPYFGPQRPSRTKSTTPTGSSWACITSRIVERIAAMLCMGAAGAGAISPYPLDNSSNLCQCGLVRHAQCSRRRLQPAAMFWMLWKWPRPAVVLGCRQTAQRWTRSGVRALGRRRSLSRPAPCAAAPGDQPPQPADAKSGWASMACLPSMVPAAGPGGPRPLIGAAMSGSWRPCPAWCAPSSRRRRRRRSRRRRWLRAWPWTSSAACVCWFNRQRQTRAEDWRRLCARWWPGFLGLLPVADLEGGLRRSRAGAANDGQMSQLGTMRTRRRRLTGGASQVGASRRSAAKERRARRENSSSSSSRCGQGMLGLILAPMVAMVVRLSWAVAGSGLVPVVVAARGAQRRGPSASRLVVGLRLGAAGLRLAAPALALRALPTLRRANVWLPPRGMGPLYLRSCNFRRRWVGGEPPAGVAAWLSSKVDVVEMQAEARILGIATPFALCRAVEPEDQRLAASCSGFVMQISMCCRGPYRPVLSGLFVPDAALFCAFDCLHLAAFCSGFVLQFTRRCRGLYRPVLSGLLGLQSCWGHYSSLPLARCFLAAGLPPTLLSPSAVCRSQGRRGFAPWTSA